MSMHPAPGATVCSRRRKRQSQKPEVPGPPLLSNVVGPLHRRCTGPSAFLPFRMLPRSPNSAPLLHIQPPRRTKTPCRTITLNKSLPPDDGLLHLSPSIFRSSPKQDRNEPQPLALRSFLLVHLTSNALYERFPWFTFYFPSDRYNFSNIREVFLVKNNSVARRFWSIASRRLNVNFAVDPRHLLAPRPPQTSSLYSR